MLDGRITLRLKTPWSDGTTHVIYEPLDLIAKLAACCLCAADCVKAYLA